MTISRDKVLLPVLPRESVQVGPLDGEVIVRGLLLRERLAWMERGQADGVDGIGMTNELLAVCVELDDGKPLFSTQEWEVFSSVETEAYFALVAVVQRLNGLDAEAVKKS